MIASSVSAMSKYISLFECRTPGRRQGIGAVNGAVVGACSLGERASVVRVESSPYSPFDSGHSKLLGYGRAVARTTACGGLRASGMDRDRLDSGSVAFVHTHPETPAAFRIFRINVGGSTISLSMFVSIVMGCPSSSISSMSWLGVSEAMQRCRRRIYACLRTPESWLRAEKLEREDGEGSRGDGGDRERGEWRGAR